MYLSSDPRSRMAGTAPAAAAPTSAPGAPVPAEIGLLTGAPPQRDEGGARTWATRGQNFLVLHDEASPGAALPRTAQIDEYVVLLTTQGATATLCAAGESITATGPALIIMPPGDSAVTLPDGGAVQRIFSTRSADLNALCSNAGSYAAPHPHMPAFQPWPDPPGGFKIRVYDLAIAPTPGRFGRIFRCTTLMVNVLEDQVGPRDIKLLSPHFHNQFEQGSLCLEGAFVHHLRWPWGADMTQWREDEAAAVGAPSLTVIPPTVIHTSRGTEAGSNRLVDIFSPPRMDFSRQEGWVLNSDDYPAPVPELT